MKKTLAAALVLAAPFFSNIDVLRAAQDVHSLPVTLTVKERFNLDLRDCSIDFGDVRQGESGREQTVHFSATTNRGAGWSIQIQSDPLKEGRDGKSIPKEDFRFAVLKAPGGEHSGSSYQPVPGVMTTIFSADKDHGVVQNAEFGLGFKVDVPKNQQTGRYSTTLYIRMTDDI